MAVLRTDINADTDILRSVAAAPAVPWTPLDLGAALKAWWSADDHGTARMIDDGAGLISSCTDKVGGMVITAATTTRPTWAVTSFNGAYAGLTFDGVANCFVSTSLGTLPTGATGGSIFLVISNIVNAGTLAALRYGGVGAALDRGIQRAGSTPTRLSITDGSTNLADTVATFDGPNIVSGSWLGTTESSRINGTACTPATATIAALATGSTRFRWGASNGTSATGFWKGVGADAIITTDLTLLQHQQLEGWAAWNKGLVAKLPAGHPYKSAAP